MIIDSSNKILQIKIVYFGPALSGKTTSLKSLFRHFGKEDQLSSIESTMNRTLFFDYGVISFQNEDWVLRVHLYTTTGQDFYAITRPITLEGIDGLIFIVDSQKSAYKRNIISWKELKSYFKDILKYLPMVIAFNKQDLPEKFKYKDFLKEIEFEGKENGEIIFTTAINGENVLKSFETLIKLIFYSAIQPKAISNTNKE